VRYLKETHKQAA